MNILRWFRKEPEVEKPPLTESVRVALRVVIEGMEPPITIEEFERLYSDVLDSEVHGRRDAAEIIDNFIEQRKLCPLKKNLN